MLRLLMALVVAAAIGLGASKGLVGAETQEDSAAMQATIEAQLDAFQRDDWAGAFTHASPAIQRLFRNPRNFGQMVRNGYPMVWRPGAVRFLGLETGPNGPRQVVVFTDQAGRTWVADYFMQEIDGVWRINGVTLRPADDVGA